LPSFSHVSGVVFVSLSVSVGVLDSPCFSPLPLFRTGYCPSPRTVSFNPSSIGACFPPTVAILLIPCFLAYTSNNRFLIRVLCKEESVSVTTVLFLFSSCFFGYAVMVFDVRDDFLLFFHSRKKSRRGPAGSPPPLPRSFFFFILVGTVVFRLFKVRFDAVRITVLFAP